MIVEVVKHYGHFFVGERASYPDEIHARALVAKGVAKIVPPTDPEPAKALKSNASAKASYKKA